MDGRRGFRLVVAAAIVLVAGSAADARAAEPIGERSGSRGGAVTFELSPVDSDGPSRSFVVELSCSGDVAARAVLAHPDHPSETRPHRSAGQVCEVRHRTRPVDGRADQMTYTIGQGDDILARRTMFSRDGRGSSSRFVVPPGEIRVGMEVRELPQHEVGLPVRAMAFNIWDGGTLGRHALGEQNLTELVEFLRIENPDILFAVETNGSGQRILDGLNAGRADGERYVGVPITNEPDQPPNADRLWLFTRFVVEKVYSRRADGDLTSDNFGGARLRLPNGSRLHAFPTWLHADKAAWKPLNQSALEQVMGLPRSYSDQDLVATDTTRRTRMATTLLRTRLPEYVNSEPAYANAPVLVAGDFNTLSHLDWTGRFAQAPGHAGLALDWPVSGQFAAAGFTDTFRWSNPDAGRQPGRTWSPGSGFGYAPGRIDYVMTKGQDVRILGSYTRNRRLPQHRGSRLDALYPFYSDHAAVVTDLLIRGDGDGPNRAQRYDPIEGEEIAWPAEPAGRSVPANELAATATSEQPSNGLASRAVDGSYLTHWHSQYEPALDPQPHDITVDMGRVRELTALRYQPRIVGTQAGTVQQGVLLASRDGTTWSEVSRVRWDRTPYPKDVDLKGTSARYLRLHVELGIGGFSSAAELIPYER